MDAAKIRLRDIWRTVSADERCRRLALRALLTPLVVSLFFPLYVLGAVSWSQLSLQRALDTAPSSVLRALEDEGSQVVSGVLLDLPDVPVSLRYLQSNGRVVVLMNVERRFEVKAPFLSRTAFNIVAASRRRLR
ncbi:MAG: hypothetical protein EP340_00455 [Alphaproteobacteria bacterium]|nr:MAG: hypothetical protein EP340_00455 [Alphaproteobacteria bacterium]